jgi:hypothetical protein
MKGVIYEFILDKGYGFIIDENYERRFFHISEVADKNLLLTNIANYCYAGFYRENPNLVEFLPLENSKGNSASKITITNEILNDKSNPLIFKAKITDLDYHVETFTKIVSGIKKGSSAPFGSTAGSNGTYRLDYPEVKKELNLSFRKSNDVGWGEINVRELALRLNSRKSVTKKFIQDLKNHLVGKEVEIFGVNDKWRLKDYSILGIK